MGKSIKLSLSVLLVISVLWKPALSDKCSLTCKGTATFPSGHSYNYGVEGTVSIYLTGADKTETSVKLLGQVTVNPIAGCVAELKVQNLVISGPDGKKYSSPPGIDKPVRFGLADGRISPEICATDGDTRRSLNIKRAIISLLQSETKPSTQVDVFGSCPTDASSSQEGSAVLVHRTRDLSRCAHREQGKHDLLNGVFNNNAEIKNTQVLQSSLHVESKVNSGIPEKVSATEEYLYKPFSVGENGARAKVHTKLTLTGKGGASDSSSQCTEARTIIFENPHGAVSGSNAEAAVSAVKDTAKTLGTEAGSKSAGEFAQLVRILRNVNKDDLVKVYGQVKGHNLEKRVFLDGLLRAGTGYSIGASIEILKKRELSMLEQQLVYLSLGNVKHANNEALKAAAGLLDMPNLPKEIYLGVGALAGSYCRDHDCHETKSDGIVAISQKLIAKMQNCKPKNKVEEDNVVAVLKGIRNIHHLEDSIIDKLVRCANDNNVKPRVRVAAIEAFSADPCATKLHKVAQDLMKNRQLDSEIRIKAYMAVIECPCAHSATEIKNLLETEPVHQVGRFISSSIRHIRASANPDKYLQRSHYGQIRTPNKFNIDDRKYSFYREMSFNIDALGVGGNMEQTVIYSQDSFLPRSASLNLTAELFGHSLNVLEVGGRQGNLDRVVEHFLGPKSFLRTEKPQDIYDNIVKRFKDMEKKVEDGLTRGRRSVKTEVDNFDKHLKAESVPYNNELDLDLYMKLFGTNAVFLSLGDDKGFDFNSLLDRMVKTVNDGVDKLKHFQEEVRAHLLFLDAELAYPTSTGFPLKLDLVGSATGRLDVATNFDLRQIYRSPKNAKIDVKLVPSTDIEIAGIFLVDADAVSTGLKVITNLHSSTGGHLIAKVLEDGRGIDLQFGLPIDKQEILTASNDLVYFSAEKGRKEKLIPIKVDTDAMEYSGCFDQLSGVVGLTLCGDLTIPFSVSGPEAQTSISKFIARYPLTGSAKVKLVLEKNDLKGYHVKGVLRNDNNGKQGFELLFEAEGSKNRRTSVSGEMVNNNEEKSVKFAVESPIKTLYGQVAYINKPNERIVFVKAKMDATEYYARAGFIVQGNDRRSVFKPIIEYQLPDDSGKHNLKVDGQLIREVSGHDTKYSLNGIKVTIPNSDEIVDINGHYSEGPRGLELDLKAKKGEHNMLVSAELKGSDAKLEFQNTLNPFINFKLNGHFENKESQYHNDVELTYGNDLSNSQNRVVLNQLLKYHKKSAEDFNLITRNKFEINALPIKASFEAEIDPKKVDVEFGGQYYDKKAEFDLEARTHIKKAGDYSVKINAEVDKKGIEILAKRDIASADKSNLENIITLKGLGKYELSGVVIHKTKQNDMNIGAIGHFKVSGSGNNEDIKFDIGATENSNLYSSHAKISYTKGEIVDYLLKITRGANPTGQLKFVLKDTIAANGNFKVTENDGKGNGMIIVDFKKSQRKIKSDVKFVVKDPVYNVDADIFLNYEKDNNDKIHITTNNKNSQKLTDSKNKVEYGGKKFEVNVHRDGTFENGKSHANIEVVLPTDRCLSLKLDQDVNIKDNVVNGQVNYVLADAAKRGGPASTISFKSKVVDTNYEKGVWNWDGQFEIKLKDGQNLQNTFSLKFIPDPSTGVTSFDAKSDVTGSLIPKPASFSATGTTIGYNKKVHDKYRIKANYGDDYSFDYTDDFMVNMPASGTQRKTMDDMVMTIRLPFEKAHDIKWTSYLLLLLNEDESGEITFIEALHLNGEVYKFDINAKGGKKSGSGKMKFVIPHNEPLVLETSYKADVESEKKKVSVDLKSQYGKGKTASVNLGAQMAPQEYGLLIQANAPQAEKLKKLEVQILSKVPAPNSYSASVSMDADGRVYSYDLLTIYSKNHPVFDLKYKCPNSQNSRIYVKGNVLDSNNGKIEFKLENVRDVSLDATSEAQINKDNVNIKLTANSDKLGLKNYKVDISSKDAGSGKRLEFHATNDNKNILSGSTSFISKQEGPKTIIEGSGSVKVKEEQKSANFKYIRTVLTEGNEQGMETFLNLAIGERSYVAESRVTNLEFKHSYVYCEEKKQCANAEIQSKINMPRPGVFQNLLNVGFDLRKLGFAPEFGLQVSNEVSEKRLPQYTLDLHVNKEEKKYYLHMYSQPEHGKFPAGVTVTLPQRVLALESLVSYPADKGFPIRGEVALHLDKNKPQHKTAARFLIDVTGSDKQHSAVAEFGFSHPKLGKEALLKWNGNLQRPNENTIKLESATTLSHPTLGNEREAKVYFEVNPVHVKFLVNTPLVKVIDLEGNAVIKDNLQQADLKFSLLEGKPVAVHAIAKDLEYFEFTTGYVDESERKLSIVGHLQPEKRVDISADVILGKEKKNIAHGALFLQDNLVKSDYGVSKDNYKYFVNALGNDLNNLEQRVKQLGDKANKEFKSTLQRVEPTFKKLDEAYKEDLEKLYKEVTNDQTLKEISQAIDEVAKFLAKMIDEVLQVSKPIMEKITNTITETAKKIQEIFEKQIEPQVKQLYANVAAVIKEYFDGLIDIVAHFAALVTDFIDKHKPEFEELTNTLAEIFKDLTRLLVAQLKEIRGRVAQIASDFTQQIKELPIINIIKEKWQELAVPEQALAFIQEGYNTVRGLLPTEESKSFADTLFNYVQKKLRQEKVDDAKEMRVIYEKFAIAVNSIFQVVRSRFSQFGVTNAINLNNIPWLSGPGQASAPGLAGSVSFSLINQILKGDVPDPLSLIRAYRPRSLNPLDEIPSKLRAVVVNGQHMFTFDGRHMTFPGNCRYVLAHDHVDRNFTLVMQLQNGAPKSLILEDKSGTTVELKDNGQVAVNGVSGPFPAIEDDVFAFKEAGGRIGLGSTYGIMAFCAPKLQVCYIEVNGFYLGKLRGLLGDGNNEPYDDFRMVNGKITNSESEFGNSYRLASSCPQVKTPEHNHHQQHAALPPACEEVFGGSSTLRPLALVLDMAPFRQACIHAASGSGPEALQQACDLGRGYTALAVSGLLPAVLPPVCVQCTDTDTPRKVGDEYEFKLPGKQADIVVAVETTISNEENYKSLVVPLVSQLVDNLKSKHFTDIKVYLVGVTPFFPYPIIYDTDLKLKNPKVKFNAKSRHLQTPTIVTGDDRIDKVQQMMAGYIDGLRIQTGATNIVAGYRAIMDLPFRPGAVKHTISVVGEKCASACFFVDILRSLTYKIAFEQMAYTHSLVTVSPVTKCGGGKNPSQIVGYSSDAVFMLGDKKENKDSEVIHSGLETDEEDACVSFVEKSDGLVFAGSNYKALNAGQQKQFLQTAAAAIINKMTSDVITQECTCTYSDPFRVRSVCVNKDRKEAARRRK